MLRSLSEVVMTRLLRQLNTENSYQLIGTNITLFLSMLPSETFTIFLLSCIAVLLAKHFFNR